MTTSLVPVSSSYAVYTEEDQTAVNAENEKDFQSEFEELLEDVEALEFSKSMVEERAATTRKHMEGKFQDLVDKLEELALEYEEKMIREASILDDDDIDFEDESSDKSKIDSDAEDDIDNLHGKDAHDRGDLFEEEDFDSDERVEAKEALSLRRQCKKLYTAIARLTHPDKTRNKMRVKFFQQAVEAYANLNLEALEDIYISVTGRPSNKLNLFQRILSLRKRKQELEREIARIKQTTSYRLHILELEEGLEEAEIRFRNGLLHRISELNALIKGDFSECEF